MTPETDAVAEARTELEQHCPWHHMAAKLDALIAAARAAGAEEALARCVALERVVEAAIAMSKRYEHWHDGKGPEPDSAEHMALMDALDAAQKGRGA